MIEQNLVRLFEDSIRMHWDMPCMQNFGENKVYTYAEVGERVEKIHLLLEQCGVKKNDKVSLVGRNSCNWVMAYVGIVTYGAIVVPILQDFKPTDMTHIVNHSESVLLFSGEPIYENLDLHEMPELKAVISLTDFHVLDVQMVSTLKEKKQVKKERKGEDLELKPILDVATISPEAIDELFAKKFANGFHKDLIRYDFRDNSEVASINYTSGTTGFSKGVITPCNALAGNIAYGLKSGLCYEGSRFVCFLPLAHAFGCAFDFLSNFCAGGFTCYYGRPLATKLLLMAFAQVKPNLILTVPLVIEKIYKKMIQPMMDDPRKSWVFSVPLLGSAVEATICKKLVAAFGGEFREIIIGGAPLNADVEAFFRKIKFPFTVGYGMTECAPLISHMYATEFKPQSCGRILPWMHVRIANPNTEGVGELEVSGENVMIGYYKNEEATKLTFTEDGWLKTGDLGYVDEDGVIYIKGRNKTMLLGPNGQNIYPEEIEAKLNNLPMVAESIVMQAADNRLVALINVDREVADKEHLTDEQLNEQMEQNRATLNKELAAYEQIARLQIYPHEFEKTPKKSIKRYLYNASMVQL